MFNHPAFSLPQDQHRKILGLVESVIYSNDDIAVFNVSIIKSKIKVVLNCSIIPSFPQIGEIWEFYGQDEDHVKYGAQFRVIKCARQQPSGALIVNYISYHLLGFGSYKAQRLWDTFGEDIYNILDAGDIRRLIGKKSGNIPKEVAIGFVEKWKQNKIETSVVAFVHEIGFKNNIAKYLLQSYGDLAISKINENPYRLLAFAEFNKIDDIAIDYFGIQKNDARRLQASILASIYKFYDSGSTAIRRDDLIKSVQKLSEQSKQCVVNAIEISLNCHLIVSINANLMQGFGQSAMEKFVSKKISGYFKRNYAEDRSYVSFDVNVDLLSTFEQNNNILLSVEQRKIVEAILLQGLVIVDVGKNVGITTCISAAIHQLESVVKIVQVSMTSDSAFRRSQKSDVDVITIDSFLLSNKDSIHDASKIVVYEANMIDLPTMIMILRLVPSHGSLVLVGDSRQLPPLGPGLVFHTLCSNDDIPIYRLSEIYADNGANFLPMVFECVSHGKRPVLDAFDKGKGESGQYGLCYLSANTFDISKIIPGLHYFVRKWGDVQIIAPTVAMCDDINIRVHNGYRESGSKKPLVTCAKTIGLDDLIICINKISNKGLTKHSIGQITEVYDPPIINPNTGDVAELCYASADFNNQSVLLSSEDFKNIKLGYCITCKQAIGHEFERVIIAIKNYIHLDNTWIYSAINCAQKQAILLGDIELFYLKCNNELSSSMTRCTALNHYLNEYLHG
jgi:exodeoxyribonuclease V alpha subunit